MLDSNRNGTEIQKGQGRDRFVVSSGGLGSTAIFSGIISDMSEGHKRDLDAELAKTKTKLNERCKNKEERRVNGQGRFERQSDQGQSGVPERGPSMTGGLLQQLPLDPKTVSAPSSSPPSPHFNPNDPEFFELKREREGPNPFPTTPNLSAQPFPYQLTNAVSSPSDLDPRPGISNDGGMLNLSLQPDYLMLSMSQV